MDFPPKIVASLVTLMYEHTVTIPKDDVKQFMDAANFLKIAVDGAAPVATPAGAANPAPANRR